MTDLSIQTITERAFDAIRREKEAWNKSEKTEANAYRFYNRAYGVFILWNELTGEQQNIKDRQDMLRLIDEIPQHRLEKR